MKIKLSFSFAVLCLILWQHVSFGQCPTIQASMFNITSVGTTSVGINWTAGNGTNVLVLARSVSAITVAPSSGTTYTVQSAVYGNGKVIGTSPNVSYIVYNGVSTNSLTVSNLNPGSSYYFSIFEYNTTGSLTPCYLTPGLTGSVTALAAPVPTTCLQIKSILVDACQATPASSNPEGYNEMVYFKNGPNPLAIAQFSIAGAPKNGVYAANKWPNPGNTWNGVVQTTTTAANVSAINASILNCGYVWEPKLGIIPPGANVILVGSQVMNPTSNSFANLSDTIYMIFQAVSTTTNGNFVNYSAATSPVSTPTNGNVGTRGLVLIDGANGCTSNTVTYEPQLLLSHNDGDGVSYNSDNTASYFNSGCKAPYVPFTVAVSPNQTICYNGQAVVTATPSGIYNSLTWSGGTGVFSSPSSLTTTYTPGATETGTVQLQCLITRTCALNSFSASAVTTISITSLPTFSLVASNGYSLCPSDSTVISYSVTNAANAGVITPDWSSPAGTGTTYTVAAPSGSTPVTYSLNLANGCGTTPQTFTVYPLASPTVTLSATTPTACVGSVVTLTATSNAGNFSWTNPVSTNSTVAITASITTTGIVTSTNSCGSDSDTYTLTVTQNPVLNVDNPNPTLCAGQSATITASGAGTYTWMPGSVLSNSIVVNSASTHTVFTSNVCNSASFAVNVVVNATPVLTISTTSISLCDGGQTSAILSLVGSTGSYTWSTGANTSTISITTPGSYSATVDAGACGIKDTSIVIGTLITPTISVVPTPTLLCDGAVATLTASSNLTNFTWSNGATNTPTIAVTTTGLYTVSVSNACGVPPASINILADVTPTLNLVSNTPALCPAQSATLTVTGGIQPYVWSHSASLTGSVVTTNGGTVSVTYTNVCGTDTETITVSVIPNPTVTLVTNSFTACPGDVINIVANSSEGNYSWSGSANTAATLSITASTTETGTVTTTNVCNIDDTDTYTINVTPAPTFTINSPNSISLCTGQSAIITATSSTGSYTWMPGGSNSNTLSVNATGDYTVYTSNACVKDSIIVSVSVNSSASLTMTSTTPTLCLSGQTATLSLSGSVGSYTWNNGSNNDSLMVNSPGVYTATVTTASCGTTSASFTINTIDTPNPISIVSTSTLLCNGATATLTAASNLSNHSWSNLSTNTPSIVVSTSGTYTVGVSNACGTASNSINILADVTPTLNLTASSTTLCPNQTATLTVTGGTAPYTWSNSSTITGSVVTTNGGTITVTNTNVCGTGTAVAIVNVVNVNASISANPTSGVKPVVVDFTNNSTGAITYLWNFGNGLTANTQTVSSQTYSVVGIHTVYLLVTNGSCTDIDSLTIEVINEDPILIIPNVFTPNNDNINDTFRITSSTNITEFNCTILNRWGLQLFYWDGIKNGWDGKTAGKDVPDGTYFYIINAKDIDGKEIKRQGHFSLFN